MNVIVAVSGGVDSVVLLHMLLKNADSSHINIIVANVDHGMRGDESAADSRFVEGLAEIYNLQFVGQKLDLDGRRDENTARLARYEFLAKQAEIYDAKIATAHHADDLIGSVAINISRGTGWRGLAVMNRPGIIRPLLGVRKRDIYNYALRNKLEWVEDSTNSSTIYTRNRLRPMIKQLADKELGKVLELRKSQIKTKQKIDGISDELLSKLWGDRYFFTNCGDIAGEELIRRYFENSYGALITRDDAKKVLLAIKTQRPETRLDISEGFILTCNLRQFIVSNNAE